MKIRDVMNTKAARIRLGQPMALAAETLVLTDAGDLMVIDDDDRFVGRARGRRPAARDHAGLRGAHGGGRLAAAGVRDLRPAGDDYAGEPIDRLVIHGSITVSGDDELLKAATVMITMGIRLLAVVDDGRLMGTVSRADVCWGVLVEQPSRSAAVPD